MKSINQDKLSKEAQDIAAWCVSGGIDAGFGFPCNMVEVRLDNPIFNMLVGSDNENDRFHRHGLVQAQEYLYHFEDGDWAIISSGDFIGDPVNGLQLVTDIIASVEQDNEEQLRRWIQEHEHSILG